MIVFMQVLEQQGAQHQEQQGVRLRPQVPCQQLLHQFEHQLPGRQE
jgi:hypothetical protein